MQHRRAKIVCTIGPAVDTPEAIRGLIEAGMDVARLNFSHGTREEHARRAEWIRAAGREVGKPVAILQDLCGPKIRTGSRVPDHAVTGDRVKLVPGDAGEVGAIPVGYERLIQDLRTGDRILLADGEIELRVDSPLPDGILCFVEHGGPLRPRMGVNLPAERVALGAITDRDRKDLEFGVELGVDYVALSFVRSAQEILELRDLGKAAGRPIPIVAKIETPSAVEQIQHIAAASDAVMLARGDLGVELPPERVPVVQKRVIEVCRREGRPVIVATQMLQSMVKSPRPTRAEASDVANAIFDGADGVMLSAETAMGEYPARACATMARIIGEAEASPAYASRPSDPEATTPDAIARAACGISRELGARGIGVFTFSGATALLVSMARPDVPVGAFSPNEDTLRRMALYWGVTPWPSEVAEDLDELLRNVREFLRGRNIAEPGDRVVLVFSTPVRAHGTTNSIRVETLG